VSTPPESQIFTRRYELHGNFTAIPRISHPLVIGHCHHHNVGQGSNTRTSLSENKGMVMANNGGSFWARAWRTSGEQRPVHDAQPDPADMGTAFGLDATFDLPAAPVGAQGLVGRTSTSAEPTMLESLWAINRLNGRSVI
jgi:hypothetical protein